MHDVAGFFKIKCTKKVIPAGRLKCCGMEDRTVVAHDGWKTKKILCGMEDRTVLAHDGWKTKKILCGMLGENVVVYNDMENGFLSI